MIKPWSLVTSESTCQKRVTVCELYSRDGVLIARESNRCSPEGGKCERIGLSNTAANYPTASCNWSHAEVNALAATSISGRAPFRAVIYGHRFACHPCKDVLISNGVREIEIADVGLVEVAKSA